MPSPTPGICFPVEVVRVIDGDTVIVRSTRSHRECRVRLRNCDAPEMGTGAGKAAKEWLVGYLDDHRDAEKLLHLPLPGDTDGSGTIDLDEIIRQAFSFERLQANLYVNGYSLSETMGVMGFAHVS